MNSAQPADQQEPIWHLLYRFLWPFQYFRDVTRGSKLERQQNYRYNRSIRHYLPGFAFKWMLVTLLCLGAGSLLVVEMEMVLPAAGCYVSASFAFVVTLQVLVIWSWLAWFPERY